MKPNKITVPVELETVILNKLAGTLADLEVRLGRLENKSSAKKEVKRLRNAIVKHRTETLLLYGDDYEGNEIDSDLWRFVIDD